jgi:glycosyltransferase involved in cell wall biosynthesis
MLSYEFPPVGGGGSAVVHGLARNLIARGHSVDVVTMGFGRLPARERVDGIDVRRVDCGRSRESKCSPLEAARYVRRAGPLVRQLVDSNDYDLIHAHFIFPDGILGRREALRRRVPLVITAHGSDVPGYNTKAFFRLAHLLLRPAWQRVTAAADELILPSHTLAKLVQRLRPKVAVQVIPNGIDEKAFLSGPKKEQILVITRLVERKGVQYLLRALAAHPPGWPVIIAGSGEYEAELLKLNEKLGRPARFVGWVDNRSERFRQLLEESAIYVLPSDFENSSIALLEAMAAGTAIVTTRGHGCEETVGDTALLVTRGRDDPERCVAELGAALLRLVRDASLRERLGSQARKRVLEHFTCDAVTTRYLDVYEAQRAARAALDPAAAVP